MRLLETLRDGVADGAFLTQSLARTTHIYIRPRLAPVKETCRTPTWIGL